MDLARSGDPTPAARHEGPAAIMEGRKAPGRIIHPGPSPGRDPGPVAVTVRRPAGRYTREPYVAIRRHRLPVSGIIQGLIADGSGSAVARRGRLRKPPLAICRPSLKFIPRVSVGDRILARLAIAELKEFARLHDQGPFLPVGLGFATAHLYPGTVVIGIHVDAVLARTGHREGNVGSIDLNRLTAIQEANPQAQRALVQFELRDVVPQIDEAQGGLISYPQCSRADGQLRPRIAVGPEPVSGGKRTIQPGRNPIFHSAGLERYLSTDQLQPRHAAGRIVVIALGSSQSGEEQQDKPKQKLACQRSHDFSPCNSGATKRSGARRTNTRCNPRPDQTFL